MLVDNFPTLHGKSNPEHFLQELSKDLSRFALEVNSVRELMKGVKQVDDLVQHIKKLEDEVTNKKAEVVQLSADLSTLQAKHSESEVLHQNRLKSLTDAHQVTIKTLEDQIASHQAKANDELQKADQAADKHLKIRQSIDELRRKLV